MYCSVLHCLTGPFGWSTCGKRKQIIELGPSKPIRDFGIPGGQIGILGFHLVSNWDFRNQVWNWNFGPPNMGFNPSEIGILGFCLIRNCDSGISSFFKLGFWDSRTPPPYRAITIELLEYDSTQENGGFILQVDPTNELDESFGDPVDDTFYLALPFFWPVVTVIHYKIIAETSTLRSLYQK